MHGRPLFFPISSPRCDGVCVRVFPRPDIDTLIVKLSELSERVEMDISLCDSQRSDCHAAPQTDGRMK